MPRTRPGEYLVAARRGRLMNLGEAANAVLFPGTAWVKVPGVQLDSAFEMTQETRDGIPLRFKGQAVYRVVRPERAAALFDFSTDDGLATVDSLVKQCCLAELRDLVSRMTLGECIEQRKTTLTGAVRGALERLVGQPEEGSGIAVEVVQVAQVYIVDRAPLPAGRGNPGPDPGPERVRRPPGGGGGQAGPDRIGPQDPGGGDRNRAPGGGHRGGAPAPDHGAGKAQGPGVPGGGSHRPGGGESEARAEEGRGPGGPGSRGPGAEAAP